MPVNRTQLRSRIRAAWLIAALLALELLDRPLYGIIVPLSALLLAVDRPRRSNSTTLWTVNPKNALTSLSEST